MTLTSVPHTYQSRVRCRLDHDRTSSRPLNRIIVDNSSSNPLVEDIVPLLKHKLEGNGLALCPAAAGSWAPILIVISAEILEGNASTDGLGATWSVAQSLGAADPVAGSVVSIVTLSVILSGSMKA